jgi:hypothetical protein
MPLITVGTVSARFCGKSFIFTSLSAVRYAPTIPFFFLFCVYSFCFLWGHCFLIGFLRGRFLPLSHRDFSQSLFCVGWLLSLGLPLVPRLLVCAAMFSGVGMGKTLAFFDVAIVIA